MTPVKEKLKVDPIKSGTVIDHITAGKALVIADVLNLNPPENLMMIGVNLHSRKMGAKDILKIENRRLTEDEMNSIALISPTATIIAIKDFVVVEKRHPAIPDTISDKLICPNPNCVTNVEQIPTRFEVVDRDPVSVRCHYCEKKYAIQDVQFKF